MTEEENIAVQKSGANARALRQSRFDNPYWRLEALPVKTGESQEDWHAKSDAWELGWRMEDAMIDGRDDPLLGLIAGFERQLSRTA